MKIILITPTYIGPELPKQTTPVVHYFTKEWVKMGHDVVVIHVPTNFPKWVYFLASPVTKYLSSKLGFIIRSNYLNEITYREDNVEVYRIPLQKFRPHGRFSKKEISRVSHKIIDYCNSFRPNIIIGHWDLPSLDIISQVRSILPIKTCLVFHSWGENLKTIYKLDANKLMENIDVLGFRSWPLKMKFENSFSYNKPSFMAFSGIPLSSFPQEDKVVKDFSKIQKFLYVGMLISRKYPQVLLKALNNSFLNEPFEITYIGSGKKIKEINKIKQHCKSNQNVNLLGQIPRDQVFDEMRKAQIFIMVSKNEVFGLVYLEAMAAGCITIASRGEGFDGIIKDGVNGFLCEAGDEKELEQVINKIRSLSSDKLNQISLEAQKTARKMTDEKCANTYIEFLSKLT